MDRTDEVHEIFETFRAWFSIQAQVRGIMLLAYCTALGFAVESSRPSIFLLAFLVVVAAVAGEIRMRFYLAPFVFKALLLAPKDTRS